MTDAEYDAMVPEERLATITRLEGEVARLRDKLALVHRLLVDDLGGWYVGAPDAEPLGRIRAALEGER